MSTGIKPLTILDWDSNFFGMRIGRINTSTLTSESTSAALQWGMQNDLACIYFLANSGDTETVRHLERHGFRFVDIRVTLDLKHPSPKCANEPHVRAFHQDDLHTLKALARSSHTDSRFYADLTFPRERCCDLYETWIERSCQGWAQQVFVLEHAGLPAGYITCHLNELKDGSIGLVSVATQAQGHGGGRALVERALAWFGQANVERVSVVTQGRNIRAQRLYQRSGFLVTTMELWYHYWFDTSSNVKEAVKVNMTNS